jgi:hypothetical protein
MALLTEAQRGLCKASFAVTCLADLHWLLQVLREILTDSAEQAKPEMAGFGKICSTLSIRRFTVIDPSASVNVQVQIENEWAKKSIRWVVPSPVEPAG